jgi:methylenetetrahydrofolate dehydrogenase (NADP+) / methenyltetrahydrofolate cyclohydrolase
MTVETQIIDGAAVANDVLAFAAKASSEYAAHGVIPGLAVVLVGENPASQVYVGAKSKAAKACGFHSVQHNLPDRVDQAALLGLITQLNDDPAIHGILVQLP